MSDQLPDRPNLEHYRKEAKALLKAHRAGDRSATHRMTAAVASPTDSRPLFKLKHAQKTVARELGFAEWTDLREGITAASGRNLDDWSQQSAARSSAPTKQRYERNPAVQRWLKEAESRPSDRRPAERGSTDLGLDAHVREADRVWVQSSLSMFSGHLITEILGAVKSGKEATVFCCEGSPRQPFDLLAAKVYRPRMFRNLKNDVMYREGRSRIKDRRGRKAIDRSTPMGLDVRMSSWIAYEYGTLEKLSAAGADVPQPVDQHGNAILMEFVGDRSGPAPMLHQVRLDPRAARNLYDRLLANIEIMLDNDRVHADLSAYNILLWNDEPTIIDFAQSVDVSVCEDAFGLVRRDVQRLCDYFNRFGVQGDAEDTAARLGERYLLAEHPVE